MRFIKLITTQGDRLINPDHVTNIFKDIDRIVKVKLSCGTTLQTKFTDIEHACDFIIRAESHSLIGG